MNIVFDETTTNILAAMEKEELIYRERNPKDKRILNVYLTQKGTETQKKVEKVFLELDEMCFDGFSQEERIDAINILNRLYENLLKNKKEPVLKTGSLSLVNDYTPHVVYCQ